MNDDQLTHLGQLVKASSGVLGGAKPAPIDATSLLLCVPVALASVLYLTMAGAFALGLWRWRKRAPSVPARAPRVTVMKPLAGIDDDLEANLASFAVIDYPSFEILFGVASEDDPATAVARAFVTRFPHLAARVVVTDPARARNPKVAQLVDLAERATGDVWVISDSNVRVPTSYLTGLVAELLEPEVALVTSLFVGTGERTLGAALENLQLATVTAPGVVAASVLTERPITVGKSMAMWRRELVRLGGFARVGDLLAEDQALGELFRAEGHRVRTVLDAVENRNVACTLGRTLDRHTRWAKIRRALSPELFALEPLLSPLSVAVLAAALRPDRITLTVLGSAAVLQTAGALVTSSLLRRRLAVHLALLEVPRALLMFGCWALAWGSRTLSWRGRVYRLDRGSRLTPVATSNARGRERGRVVHNAPRPQRVRPPFVLPVTRARS